MNTIPHLVDYFIKFHYKNLQHVSFIWSPFLEIFVSFIELSFGGFANFPAGTLVRVEREFNTTRSSAPRSDCAPWTTAVALEGSWHTGPVAAVGSQLHYVSSADWCSWVQSVAGLDSLSNRLSALSAAAYWFCFWAEQQDWLVRPTASVIGKPCAGSWPMCPTAHT